jgi:hypothetical protein
MEIVGRTTVNEAVFQAIAEIVLKNIDDVVAKERKGPLAGLSRILVERSRIKVRHRIWSKIDHPQNRIQKNNFDRLSFLLQFFSSILKFALIHKR